MKIRDVQVLSLVLLVIGITNVTWGWVQNYPTRVAPLVWNDVPQRGRSTRPKAPFVWQRFLATPRALPVNRPPSTASSLSDFQQALEQVAGTPRSVDVMRHFVRRDRSLAWEPSFFQKLYPFPLDDFQTDALQSILTGRNIIVTTPTGSGKTLIGELAVYHALSLGKQVIYTTPLKALSNQKVADFKQKFGNSRVGLVTGDVTHNNNASVLVMTTEIFRSRLYEQDVDIHRTAAVVFDEFHYMKDDERGTVWEESVMQCPQNVSIIALSATIGNAEAIQSWMETIHAPTDLVVCQKRPVPLRYFISSNRKLYRLFRQLGGGPGGAEEAKGLDDCMALNPRLHGLEAPKTAKQSTQQTDNTFHIIKQLKARELLPAIFFTFSRNGCEKAAFRLALNNQLDLVDEQQRSEVAGRLRQFLIQNPWVVIPSSVAFALLRGVGCHHAGLIPRFKSFVEQLFADGLVPVIFATETLAAGINMPARTTVIPSTSKMVARKKIELQTSDLLQMAGRAGRRGKDDVGCVVFVMNEGESIHNTHMKLTADIEDIQSRLKISYSLVVRLLARNSHQKCKSIIGRNFAEHLKSQQQRKERNTPDNAWTAFEATRAVLEQFNALDGFRPTTFGKSIGASNADNSLWFILTLFVKGVKTLKPEEFAMMLGAIVNEPDMHYARGSFGMSQGLRDVFRRLRRLSLHVENVQHDAGVDCPIYFSTKLINLIRRWYKGETWLQLCESTSADQGDIYRYLRRTTDALSQIVNVPSIPRQIVHNAKAALKKLDRDTISERTFGNTLIDGSIEPLDLTFSERHADMTFNQQAMITPELLDDLYAAVCHDGGQTKWMANRKNSTNSGQ